LSTIWFPNSSYIPYASSGTAPGRDRKLVFGRRTIYVAAIIIGKDLLHTTVESDLGLDLAILLKISFGGCMKWNGQ
jgi:hypothetical protein